MPLLQVDHLNSCIINSGNNVGLCSTSYGTSLNVLQQTPSLTLLGKPLRTLDAKCISRKRSGSKKKEKKNVGWGGSGGSAREKERERENHCTFVQSHYYTDPSEFKATVIELVSSQARTSLPVGPTWKTPFPRERSFDHARAGPDARQAGLFPQLIFFHNPPCTLNLIILAPGQTATAFQVAHTVSETLVTRVIYSLKRQGSGKRLSTLE